MISVCLLSETTVVSVVSNSCCVVAMEIGGPSAESDTPDRRHVPVAHSRVFQMLLSSPSCQLLLNTCILVWIRWSGQDSGSHEGEKNPWFRELLQLVPHLLNRVNANMQLSLAIKGLRAAGCMAEDVHVKQHDMKKTARFPKGRRCAEF